MKSFHAFGAALVATGVLTFTLHAQIPSMPSVPGGVPSAPSVPGAPSIPGAPSVPGVPGAPATPSNIWSQLLPSQAQCQKLQQAFCAHPLGQMIVSMMQPVTLYSGGLISSCCPQQPNPNALAAGADTTEGAVAAIQADEAGAKARRAEMRYLGTVDCHYWPEAEAALIKGLRTDKNECVRWEAANSLGRGCCCTRKTIEALVIAATGSERDGNPAELSEWVKGRALKSINHCLCCYREKPSTQPKEKPVKAASAMPNPLPSSPSSLLLPRYYATLDRESMDKIIAEARQAVAKLDKPSPNALIPGGRHTVSDIMTIAATGELAPDNISTDAKANAPLQPVPAGTPIPPPAPVPPPPNTDLLHFFRSTKSSPPSPEPPPAAAQQIVPQQTGVSQSAATTAPVSSPLPPTGNRDLWHVIRNSISGD